MATTVYLTNDVSDINPGSEEDLLARVGSRGSGFSSGVADTSTVGATLTRDTAVDVILQWFTLPLDPVTISGTITINFWMAESNMSANVDAQINLTRHDSAGAFISTISGSAKGTELPVTTRAAQNWTATPTSTTLAAGDRLRIRMVGGDTLGQAAGFTFTGSWGTTSASVDGDSWVQFTETITEQEQAQPRYGFVNHADPGLLMQQLGARWRRDRCGILTPEFA